MKIADLTGYNRIYRAYQWNMNGIVVGYNRTTFP
jgi:hypothetical protein